MHISCLYTSLQSSPLNKIRGYIRRGVYTGHTAGLGDGYLQVNLVIMPKVYADDFQSYCLKNPKPCPLIGISKPGIPFIDTLGENIDLRTDIPSYSIYQNGTLLKNTPNILEYWEDDFVAFALGCSFTFEKALTLAGIDLWHIKNNAVVPMYISNIMTKPSGIFHGKVVVSMRMISQDQLTLASTISEQYPFAHGAPIHWGDPEEIGIDDLSKPDWGDRPEKDSDKIPVFWACGVTPQVALEEAKLPLSITHQPGHMLITDIPEDSACLYQEL